MIAKKNEVFIPELNFPEVPDSFSAKSSVVKIETDKFGRGIAFNSLEEIEYALRLYNGETGIRVPKSMTTTDVLLDDAYEAESRKGNIEGGMMAVGLISLAGAVAQKNRDVVGHMIHEAKANIASTGRYKRDFDYDGMGTSFMKTSFGIEKVDDKFVLEIWAAYVGDEPEAKLAENLGVDRALKSVSVKIMMSPVDGWWYNFDLKEVLAPVIKQDDDFWKQQATSMVDRHADSIPMYCTEGGEEFELTISVENDYYSLMDADGKRDSRALAVSKDTSVMGAAWKAYRDDEDAPVEAQNKALILRIRYREEQKYSSTPIVDLAKTELLVTAAKEIENKLLEKMA